MRSDRRALSEPRLSTMICAGGNCAEDRVVAEHREWPATAEARCARGLRAVEGSAGIGRHVAQRLVADGETVLDVPVERSARVRVLDTGEGRKTDPVDAHSVAVVGLRSPQLWLDLHLEVNVPRPQSQLVSARFER